VALELAAEGPAACRRKVEVRLFDVAPVSSSWSRSVACTSAGLWRKEFSDARVPDCVQ
jgi:hypothetical protein